MNLNPKIWGPHAWFFLDSIVMGADNDNLQTLKSFFEQIKYVLPCEKCRLHYTEYLRTNPLDDVSTKDELLIWLHNLHNKVRVRNGSEPRNIKSVLKFYNQQYNTSRVISYCTITLAIVAIFVIFFKRRTS